jgi:hypothetical protein
MRREVLFNSVSTIINDIEICGVLDFFERIFEEYRLRHSQGKEKIDLPLDVFQKYMIATNTYGDDLKYVCKIVKIDSLLDVSFWQHIFKSEIIENIENIEDIHRMLQNLKFATNQLPKILSLIEQDYITGIKNKDSNVPEELKGKSLLTVLIVEEEGQFSSPLRLKSALGAITELYSVIATLEKENESDLIVLACDSGSDKSFDFLGLAKLMEEVKEIIITIWDRRVFHRQRHVSESISLIAESLPVLERIAELRENGSIGKEQAELLKRKIISGATQFIEAGATIPEFNSVSTHDPKQLMRPEPKLLVSPCTDGNVAKNEKKGGLGNTDSFVESDKKESLSEDESKMLNLLLKKSKSFKDDDSGDNNQET